MKKNKLPGSIELPRSNRIDEFRKSVHILFSDISRKIKREKFREEMKVLKEKQERELLRKRTLMKNIKHFIYKLSNGRRGKLRKSLNSKDHCEFWIPDFLNKLENSLKKFCSYEDDQSFGSDTP